MPRSLLAVLIACAPGCGDNASGGSLSSGSADAAGGVPDGDVSTDAAVGADAGEPEPIVFSNAGGAFVWASESVYEGDVVQVGAFLDVTVPAASQTGEISPSAVLFFRNEPSGLGTPGVLSFRGWRQNEAVLGASLAAGEDLVVEGTVTRTYVPPAAKSAGGLVGPDDRWRAPPNGVQTAHLQDPGDNTGPDQVWFTDGIFGVSFEADDGVHYGFVEVAWDDPDDDLESANYIPVRWGYDPVPDRPLTIPP